MTVSASFERLTASAPRTIHRRSRVIKQLPAGRRKAIRVGLNAPFRFGEVHRLTVVVTSVADEVDLNNNVRVYRLIFLRD